MSDNENASSNQRGLIFLTEQKKAEDIYDAAQYATMTVEQLRNALEGLEGSLLIHLEGCDCVGRAVGVEVQDFEDGADVSVLLRRGDGVKGDL